MTAPAKIIDQTEQYVRQKMEGEGTGHDWWHVSRVRIVALNIAEKEGGDRFIIELAALLHDIADWKFHDGDSTIGPKQARSWLQQLDVTPEIVDQVAYIVEHISFKGGTNQHKMTTLEGKIVQDADRLDAMGAIGIARTFAFGGAAGRPLYDPDIPKIDYESFESFKDQLQHNHTINHFYEKLLLLKDKMNTKTAKTMAQQRHEFMEAWLEQFYAEWKGER
jgi:uncharacterized protein